MKRSHIAFAFALVLATPSFVMAQTTRVRAIWDINPSSEGVDYYYTNLVNSNQEQNIYVNGPNCNISANNCYAEFDVANSSAKNVIEVWAHNQWGWSPAGAQIEFTFGLPSVPSNLRITTSTNSEAIGFSNINRPGPTTNVPQGTPSLPPLPPIQRPPSVPSVK